MLEAGPSTFKVEKVLSCLLLAKKMRLLQSICVDCKELTQNLRAVLGANNLRCGPTGAAPNAAIQLCVRDRKVGYENEFSYGEASWQYYSNHTYSLVAAWVLKGS